MMTELKILVHNINDVVNRAAFEKELNVYLKMGWSLRDTHQAVSPGTGFLMMTAVLEKEGEETDGSMQKAEDSKQGAVEKGEAEEGEKTESSKQAVEKEEAKGSEQGAEKESEERNEKEENREQEVEREERIEKDASKESGGETVPKGFKIKEKKEEDQESAGKGKQKAGEEKGDKDITTGKA